MRDCSISVRSAPMRVLASVALPGCASAWSER
jgi:hypothetical protein